MFDNKGEERKKKKKEKEMNLCQTSDTHTLLYIIATGGCVQLQQSDMPENDYWYYTCFVWEQKHVGMSVLEREREREKERERERVKARKEGRKYVCIGYRKIYWNCTMNDNFVCLLHTMGFFLPWFTNYIFSFCETDAFFFFFFSSSFSLLSPLFHFLLLSSKGGLVWFSLCCNYYAWHVICACRLYLTH